MRGKTIFAAFVTLSFLLIYLFGTLVAISVAWSVLDFVTALAILAPD